MRPFLAFCHGSGVSGLGCSYYQSYVIFYRINICTNVIEYLIIWTGTHPIAAKQWLYCQSSDNGIFGDLYNFVPGAVSVDHRTIRLLFSLYTSGISLGTFGKNGEGISGGEKQKIGIVRTLAKDVDHVID